MQWLLVGQLAVAFPESTRPIPETILFVLLWLQGLCVMQVAWHSSPRAPGLRSHRKRRQYSERSGSGCSHCRTLPSACKSSLPDCLGSMSKQLFLLPQGEKGEHFSPASVSTCSIRGSPWELVRNVGSRPLDLLNPTLGGVGHRHLSHKLYTGF